MQEKIVETKKCRFCNINFEITDKDLEFYDKVSPVFSGKKYNISTPTLCPDCRQQRRLCFRNERKLYKRKCDATGKDLITMYSPDKKYIVYDCNYWWSDKWDSMDYGVDFDFSKSFFEQFNELLKKVPKLSLINIDKGNAKYCNNSSSGNKDCYLLFIGSGNENCHYSYLMGYCINCIDILWGISSNNCYDCIKIDFCNNCFFSINISNCSDCYYVENSVGIKDCMFCFGLINKQYYFLNKKYSKIEYFEILNKIKNDKELLNKTKKDFQNLEKSSKRNPLNMVSCENSIGENLFQCKNCNNCFDISIGQDLKFCYDCYQISDSYDVYLSGATNEKGIMGLIYDVENSVDVHKVAFSSTANFCKDCYYVDSCYNCSNLFGCIGLKNKSYCILNKQYTKEEYEKLVPEIIEYMRKTGEWGEFFPSSISPFGYNETVAQEYFSITKEEAEKKGFKWSDYESPFPKVEKIIPASKLPDNIADIPDDILNWAIECEVTKKPFRIIKQELEFYRKHNLPIPRRHPDQRHLDRMALRNPRKLFDRKCDKCGKVMKTTYNPERKEIVYCEECYNSEIY